VRLTRTDKLGCMASRKEIITGTGLLRGNGRQRSCRFRVTKTTLLVNELTTDIGNLITGPMPTTILIISE
jgi:hypothetical protein